MMEGDAEVAAAAVWTTSAGALLNHESKREPMRPRVSSSAAGTAPTSIFVKASAEEEVVGSVAVAVAVAVAGNIDEVS